VLAHRETAVIAGTHGAHMAMYAHLLAFEASALSRCERAAAGAVADASLLVEFTLDDLVLLLRRCGLGECKGGRDCECRHKQIFK